MKVATRQIKGFLSAIPQNINAVLLHGNDLGMISEYGAKIAGQVAPDIDDVFSVTRLSGEQVSGVGFKVTSSYSNGKLTR